MIPLDQAEERNKMERGFYRLRLFNILDLTNYPHSIDGKFATRSHLKPTMSNEYIISKGFYEQWRGVLNTCSSSARNRQVPFRFDFREVAPAKQKYLAVVSRPECKDSRKIGNSIDRSIQIPCHNGNMIIGTPFCEFEEMKKPEGVAYTDPYFSKVPPPYWRPSLRHVFKPGLKGVYIKPGTLSHNGPWGVHYEYQKDIIQRIHTEKYAFVVVMLN